ncbi:hypothetical protein E4U43_003359 [Claviceps pusilla]|uniref:Cell wall protein n=1 Tax=Claviceps pusilla TaxID=123648 RepID=A0A9P7NH03_9HYPO|nr:hypothetical protein E4U43_003359 [Claviceps pusilla]
MRVSTVLLWLASQALASRSLSLAERDLSTVSGVLQNVQSDIQNVDSAVKTGGTDPEPLLKASNALVKTLKDSKTKVDGSNDLRLTDAVKLTQTVQDTTKSAQDLVDNLKAMRGTIEKLGYCDAVRTQTSSINDGSQALIKSVISKVPEEAQDIASQLSAGLVKVLKQVQEDFSEQNCKNSAGAAKPSDNDQPTSSPPATGASTPVTSSPYGTSTSTSSNAAETTAAPKSCSCCPTATGTGGMTMGPSGTNSPPVPAGAARAAFAPAGALALAVAALVM